MIFKLSRSVGEQASEARALRFFRAGLLSASMALVVGTPLAQAAGDAAAGEGKAYTCLGCHGVKHYVNTYPSYHVPKIAGQHAEYLVAALQAYRAKTRSHPTMQANAALLSDQDIEDIAAWFAVQGASN
ncbi:MAG: cytochrome c [Granulosicoccus sp.]